jgi:Ca-activated chloride channel family protein
MRTSFALLAFFVPAVVTAQGIIVPRCPVERPDGPNSRCFPTAPAVVRTASDVRVELRDRVLRYEVEERFVNRGGGLGEVDYVFPLPKGAAFRDLKLSIDGQMVSGETLNATEARQVYEDIVRRQRDPALVEWMGHGMLRVRIFPFNAGEERRIIVRFESVAGREGDAVRVDYFRGTQTAGSRIEDRGSRDLGGRTNFQLTYRAGGELGEAYSPTHELDIERDETVRRVAIRNGGPDVTVLVSLRRTNSASVALLANARRDENGFALITVTPPADVANARLPRDVTFVMDVSGSMGGKKLEQAKAAGRQLLRSLGNGDRFRVIDFSSDVRSFRDGFTRATEENVRDAERYIDRLEANGGTNIAGALEEALRINGGWESKDGEMQPAERDRLALVLFMTDGMASVGDRDPAAIAARAAKVRGQTRIFTFGLGQDVNIGLIEQLALEGRGTPHFVRPDENVERAVSLVATQLRQPLLTDVRISVDGSVRLSRMYPQAPIDVFAGEDLVLLARYEGSGTANVVVTGRSGNREVRWSTERVFPREESENAFVPRLWATQRIGWLTSEKRRNGANAEINEEIRSLGERFGIPTEFTSYLVKEPGMNVAVRQRMDIPALRAVGASGGTTGASSGTPAPQAVQFEAAKSAAEQRAAKSVAAADMSSGMNDSMGSLQLVKRAGAKMFSKDGERWTDTRTTQDLRVYKVKAYSRSYFALLQKLPELRESFAIGDRVLVSGKSVAIEVVDDAAELTESELAAVVKGW